MENLKKELNYIKRMYENYALLHRKGADERKEFFKKRMDYYHDKLIELESIYWDVL